MYLVRYDYRRGIKLRWHQVVWRTFFAYPYWRLLRKFWAWGFFETPEGAYVRWRDFTPLFWRTLINRELEKWERAFDDIKVRGGSTLAGENETTVEPPPVTPPRRGEL